MNNGLTKEGYGDLQKLADLGNEAETLRRENSALRAELTKALEELRGFRDQTEVVALEKKKAAEDNEPVKGIKRYTVDICDACVNGDPGMCNEPGCAFCRRTDKEVRYILDATLIRAIVDGKPIVSQEGEEIIPGSDIREAYRVAVERCKRLEDAARKLVQCQHTMECKGCPINCPLGEHIPTKELKEALEATP